MPSPGSGARCGQSYPQGWRARGRGGTVEGMRGWWREATGLVLPVECAGCGAPRAVLCERCRAVLLDGSASRVRPSPMPRGLPVVYAVAAYAGACRSILLAHKERGALRLAGPLGAALALAVCAVVWRGAWSRGAGAEEEWPAAASPARERTRPPGGGGSGWTPRPVGAWVAPARRPVRAGRSPTGARTSGADGWARVRGEPADPGIDAGRSTGRGRGVGEACSELMAGTRSARALPPILLVPVPSARRAVAARGHDPTRRIALAAARVLREQGVPARVLSVLRQRRGVVDQAGLGAAQRMANVSGALRVTPGAERLLSGGPVVLVDDLMTTGATLAEAARAVRAAMGRGTAGRADGGSGGRGAAGEASGVWRGTGSGAAVAGRTGIRVSAGADWSGVPGALAVPGVGSVATTETPGVGPAREGLVGAAVVAASHSAFGANRN